MQSAGAAVAWQVDVHNVSYLNQLIINWVLTTVSYPLLLLLIILGVKDETINEELINEYKKSGSLSHLT